MAAVPYGDLPRPLTLYTYILPLPTLYAGGEAAELATAMSEDTYIEVVHKGQVGFFRNTRNTNRLRENPCANSM